MTGIFYGIKACNTLDIGIICMHCLIFSPPGENPIMKPPLWRNGIWWKLQVCNLLHYTDSRSFTGSMRNMSVSLYAHTDRFLLQGYAFLFHKQNRNLAPSFPQTHTLTKPFPQILITFSSPEILSLKQSLFIFTCNSVSPSEHPEITVLLSVEHLSWVCSQHWHNDSVYRSTMTGCHGPVSTQPCATIPTYATFCLGSNIWAKLTPANMFTATTRIGKGQTSLFSYGGICVDGVMLMCWQRDHI